MKNIGIITTFRQPNWGSVLQAFALQKALGKLGCNSELIDYKYPNPYHWSHGVNWGKSNRIGLFKRLRLLFRYLFCMVGVRKWDKMQLLEKFIKLNIKVSSKFQTYEDLHKNSPIYDIYMSGSDQIWNPNTMFGDMTYFLDFAPLGKRKVSYASSFSCLSIPNEYVEDYKKNLSMYYAISVRENNGKSIVKQLINRDAEVVLDPTLLLNKDEWSNLSNKAKKIKLPEKYILCYTLSYFYDANEPMSVLLEKIQKQYNMPVVGLRLPPKYKGNEFVLPNNYSIGVEEFLYLIKNASIVVTSSFHGAAFSLNFGKPLIALAESNGDDRIPSLLEKLKLRSSLVFVNELNVIDTLKLNPFYDFLQEQNELEDLREKSMCFLRNAVDL